MSVLIILISLATLTFITGGIFKIVKADTNTGASDTLRTGWYPDQTNLSPDLVSGGTFGQLFSATVDGQIYGQPLISDGIVFVGTETNNIYGLNPTTGAQLWKRNVGVPFNPADVTCSDLVPSVGITSTPVIDPATHTAYFTSKTYLSGNTGEAAWYMHAVDISTGAEHSGFPVRIQGVASNDPTHTFNAARQLQRTGLLLLNGVIYAAFGGHCDRKPYEGWIAGVSTAGNLTTMWTSEAGVLQNNPLGPGAGIWFPGSGLLSDGPGQIVVTTGNGVVPPVSAGKQSTPRTLAQAVVRLAVQANGSLKATDFFSPYDADLLNNNDSDLGSGSPVELPAPYFGTSTYPHLLLQVGKQGYLFLLNADNLGGRAQGPSNSDAVINRIGPNGGLWGKPSVWPGDGGYVYMATAQGGGGSGKLKAYHYGLDGSGKPTLSLVATTSDTFGFSSSSPVITSSGTTSDSALVWVIWSPDGTGIGAQLRAYDAVPVNGILHLRYSAPIGTASKFNSPGINNNHLYVGTRDGHVLGFGYPVNSPLTAAPLDLGKVITGHSATAKLVITANTKLTVTALNVSNPAFILGSPTPGLPASLTPGQTLSIPITFTPKAVGLAAADLLATTSAGQASFGLAGTGESAIGQISVSPSPISFGGVAAGGNPVTSNTTFTNVGATPITITGSTLPKLPFSVSGLPALRSILLPNASVTVTLTFAPTAIGSYTDRLALLTTGGEADVPMSGAAGTPGKLTITPSTIDVGNVPIGANGVAAFTVSNTGGSPLNITRSKYPIAGVGFSPYSTLPEGTTIAPGASLHETVLFSPTVLGHASDNWSINSDDGTGVKTITFVGTGIARVANPTLPAIYIVDTTLAQPATGSTTANFTVTLVPASISTVTVKYTTYDGTATVANGDYVATAGTLTFNPGETSKTVSVKVNGRTVYGLASSFLLNLSSPTNAVLGDTSGKARLERSLGLYGIYAGDVAVNASATGSVTASFPVTLSTPPTLGDTVTVTVATADGSAKAGTDYTALPTTTLTFYPGETTKNVSVTVKSAPRNAGNKTFALNLASPSTNASLADAQALATIVNGGAKPLPSVYIKDVSLVRPTSGTANATFVISLGATSTSVVTIDYATHDGTAKVANGYYLPTNGSVTFNPGETSKTVSVTVRGDVTREPNVYFYLNLTQASNALLSDNAGRATLINQLGNYTMSALDASALQNTSAQALVLVPVALDVPVAAGQIVTVQVSTTNGSATAGAQGDYIALPLTTLTFNPGQQVLQVPVLVNAHTGTTTPKTFTLSLSKASSNVVFADTNATITLISHN